MKYYKLFTLILLLPIFKASSQTDFGSWLIYKNSTKLTDKLSFNGQFHFRSFEFDFERDQTLVTSGFSYAVSSNVTLSAGYRHLDAKNNFIEHGAYQGIVIKSKLEKLKITNAFSIEERWINGDLQLRYKVGVDLGFTLAPKTELVLYDHVFLANKGNSFNQNRLGIKTNYKINDSFSFSAGLMHWQFSSLHRLVGLFTISHNLDLRKQKPSN